MIIRRQDPQNIAVERPCGFEGVPDDLNDRPDPPIRSSGAGPDISG
jgi:hypothetical protein